MFGIVDRIILVGKGVEARVTDLLDSLVKEGEKSTVEIPSRKDVENRLVEEGITASKKILSHLKKDKEEIKRRIDSVLQGLCERLDLVSRDDIDVIERMASKAREQVDRLEKRIEELEKKGG